MRTARRRRTYEARAHRRAGERGVRSLRRMFTTWIERPNSNLNDYALERSAPSAVWEMPPKNSDILAISESILL